MKRIAILAMMFVALGAGKSAAQSKDELTQAAHTYQSRCISCHQPPDLGFATDRAWLDQVNRTG